MKALVGNLPPWTASVVSMKMNAAAAPSTSTTASTEITLWPKPVRKLIQMWVCSRWRTGGASGGTASASTK